MDLFSVSKVLCGDDRITIDRSCLALCKIDLTDGKPPEWIMLVPAGDHIKALDGREFSNSDPQKIVDAFNADPRDLQLDWEHASEIKSPKGEQAPAAAWVDKVEDRKGAVWGHVNWNEGGFESVKKREYKYISPAFLFNVGGKIKNLIIELTSVALVNRPAFDMPALAKADLSTLTDEEIKQVKVLLTKAGKAATEKSMDTELLALLGLAEDATKEQVLEAITGLKGAGDKAKTDLDASKTEVVEVKKELETARSDLKVAKANISVPLDKFAPRPDYDAAVARAEKAESEIKENSNQMHKANVDAAVKAALEAGKITPATEEYHRGQCSSVEDLAKFNDYVKAAPAVAKDSNLKDKKVKAKGDGTVTESELAIAGRCGLTKEQFLAGKEAA